MYFGCFLYTSLKQHRVQFMKNNIFACSVLPEMKDWFEMDSIYKLQCIAVNVVFVFLWWLWLAVRLQFCFRFARSVKVRSSPSAGRKSDKSD